MLFLNRRVSSGVYFTFIVLLSALPVVRADYSSAIWKLTQAFLRFTIPIPSSAAPDEIRLATHLGEYQNNVTKWYEANAKYYEAAEQNNETLFAEWQKERDEANQGIDYSWYQLIADYMGVGVPRSCQGGIEAALDGATEWDRAGQQAASLIMALLPSLLTFGLSH
jgi:hypothetical protein